MTQEFDNRGQVSLWKPNSDNPKAPQARGEVVAHRDIKEGETLEIALWRNNSDNPKAPVMKGKVSDKQPQSQQTAQQQSQDFQYEQGEPQNTGAGGHGPTYAGGSGGGGAMGDDIPFSPVPYI